MSTKSELEAAYRRTHYRVFLPGGAIELQIGHENAALRDWLKDCDETVWCVLTAFNPASQVLPAEANAERQAELEVRLLERGFEPYAGENVDPDGVWPTEETCFVSGISLREALAIARDFQQNAIIHGDANGTPLLAWVDQGI